jgi:uncharacterized membrane protein YebE (DUF533 family)
MKKGLIIGGSIVALLIIAYFGYNWYKKRNTATKPNAASSSNPITGTKPAAAQATANNVNMPFNPGQGFTAANL